MKIVTTTLLVLIFGKISSSLPQKNLKHSEFSYAGSASQIIATSLLKDNIDIDGNHVYSPLGITSVLAILAEGSKGETYNEFVKALGYPKEKSQLRDSFKRVLENFHSQDIIKMSPSFRTWFYVYRNNTACDEYKQILRDFYFVDVKDIDRTDYDWNEPDTAVMDDGKTHENSKDVIGFESLKKSQPFDDDEDGNEDVPLLELNVNDNASKFDKFVDDKQYVETPLIKEEIIKEQTQSKTEKRKEIVTETESKIKSNKSDDVSDNDGMSVFDESLSEPAMKKDGYENIESEMFDIEDNETIKANEKIEALKKNFANSAGNDKQNQMNDSNEPQKITIPLQNLEAGGGEVMQALERHFTGRSLGGGRKSTLFNKDDIASALSANSITGREISSKTKMLLFNGLYYRGNWAYPFQELRNNRKDVFYTTNDKTMPVLMMRSRGNFPVADLTYLKSKAIEFPYENNRYSLLAIVPNEKDGLRSVIEKIEPLDLQTIKSALKERSIFVSLPKFTIEETSRSEATLQRLGLKRLFSRELSELSGISNDSDLHVEEVVQFVSIRVDEGASSQNALSASNEKRVLENSNSDEEKLEINRPFLYFIIDNVTNFVIMSGKVCDPEFMDEPNVDLEAEYAET